MAYQAVFKRYEMKYMLTPGQKERMLKAMQPYMKLDEYGRTTIRNIYFDTDSYRLIRRSIEKPAYKEKLRLRSYTRATPDTKVFVELKKKHDHVVYKRRLTMAEGKAMEWIRSHSCPEAPSQISREIDYVLSYYQDLRPSVFLSYQREAYYSLSGDDFRVTFDDTILARQQELSLTAPVWGTSLLPPGRVLMEIKCSGGLPLWMARALSEQGIYKTSFSKYGTAYETMIYPNQIGGYQYA